MNKLLVLIVDDEKPLRDFIRRNLEARGYATLVASNALEALAYFNTNPVELVILDVMMAHLDGLETVRRIRQTSAVPVIMLSALGEENDIIRALNLGADDYLVKPFGVGELMARIQAVLRRSRWVPLPTQNNGPLVCGEISADLDTHMIVAHGQMVELTPTEFNLLVYLMENKGKVLSHQNILKNVWGQEYGAESEYLRVYIGRLRQKIERDPANPNYLRTERGLGYSFHA